MNALVLINGVPPWLVKLIAVLTDQYLTFLDAVVLIVGANYTLKAVFLAALIIQTLSAALFFFLIWLVGVKVTKDTVGSAKAGLIFAALIAFSESLMTLAVPNGGWVFSVEVIAGIVIFGIWRGIVVEKYGKVTVGGNTETRTTVKIGKP